MVEREDITENDLIKKPKRSTSQKPKKPTLTLEETFQLRLQSINIEDLKKPWMASKVFRLVDTIEDFQQWATSVIQDTSRYKTLWDGQVKPVLSVDTETTGLDIRVIRGRVRTRLAGICLSIDGVEGLYIPINHTVGPNIEAKALAPLLQKLFDQCHLVFFNAKFDREVLRLTMGITFKDFPAFEDVQVLNYLYDPKMQLDEDNKKGGFIAGGLKPTAKALLDIEQIELDELVKVKTKVVNPVTGKSSYRQVYAPFTWVPPQMAVWYAAGDAITTWLLWEYLWDHHDFSKMRGCHKLDHLLIDTITWMERQRLRVDHQRHQEVVAFHRHRVQALQKELAEIAEEPDLNPASAPQLDRILFSKRGMTPLEKTKKGKNSTAVGVLKALHEKYPDDLFLTKLMDFREYAALHPEELAYAEEDQTARFYFKQNVVAGGRLSAAGGEYPVDGGCNLNVQAIKKIGGNWWIYGKRLVDQSPEALELAIAHEDTSKLDPSCFDKKHTKAPNIHANNHTGDYFGINYCLVPDCPQHTGERVKIDANEVLNLRGMFVTEPGWTLFSTDYSNVEMRCAANASGEESFVKEFLEGSGDFHTLTAIALFPEFSDPTTPKPRTKELRGLAKIVNFALLYGGTSYTIFENLNKAGFHVTKEEAQALVDRYWSSVPTFAAWCQRKQFVAQSEFLCHTPMGRVIKFESAMEAEKIHRPTDLEKSNFFAYKKLLKAGNECERKGDEESASQLRDRAEHMWANKETGIRNYQEYSKFLGKVARVSVNIPLQGTAGDMMRRALVAIRLWATANPGVEHIFRLHGTVHDEIVYAGKNEFLPYLIPRINRIMKLRSMHKARNWMVPLETDCEYGQSWDMSYHLTGDKEHTAAGWTGVTGMEHYIPDMFDPNIVTDFIEGWKQDSVRAVAWCKSLHERVQDLVTILGKTPVEDLASVAKQFTTILQLHEFWITDEDNEDKTTLVEWADQNGLKIPTDPLIGELPSYLASIPLDGEPVVTPEVSVVETAHEEEEVTTIKDTSYEDVFLEQPVAKPVEVVKQEPPTDQPAYTKMKTIRVDELQQFAVAVGLGAGLNTLYVYYGGQLDAPLEISNTLADVLPREYQL